MRHLVILLQFIAISVAAQHTGNSYVLHNETGRFELASLTVTHNADNQIGVTFILGHQEKDTLYRIESYLNGYVALSNDGRTVAHLVTEKEGKPLDASNITFYRDGKVFDSVKLAKLISYDLKDVLAMNRLPKSGWLKNDSLLHKMATNPFYITDDRLFISFNDPILMVFDMNQMFHIYTGNGANHFMQNYFSIPNPPRREEMLDVKYFPKDLPLTLSGQSLEKLIEKATDKHTTEKSIGSSKVEIAFLLSRNGVPTLTQLEVEDAKGEHDHELEESIRRSIETTKFSTDLIPPRHPMWLFEATYFLK